MTMGAGVGSRNLVTPSTVFVTWITIWLVCSEAIPTAAGQADLACSPNKITNGDPIAGAIAHLVWNMKNAGPSLVTAPRAMFCYTSVHEAPSGATGIAYGSAACNSEDLPSCAACLDDALNALSGGCPDCNGGQVVFLDCFMRFEAYAFCS